MWRKEIVRFCFLSLTLLLNACAGLSLKAPPISESQEVKMLIDSGAHLRHDDEGLYPFNHTWNSGHCASEPSTPVFVNPVDISRIDPGKLSQSNLDAEQVRELAHYAQRKLEGAFSEEKENFQLVERPPLKGRVVELAVVELSGTEVARNVLGTALGAVIPGGGLIAMRSSGTIGIEGVVKEADTGKPLFIFADRERGKTAPFSFNDFRPLSHAKAAIDDWSQQIVASCAAAPGTKIPDSSPLTLLPL